VLSFKFELFLAINLRTYYFTYFADLALIAEVSIKFGLYSLILRQSWADTCDDMWKARTTSMSKVEWSSYEQALHNREISGYCAGFLGSCWPTLNFDYETIKN